MIINSNMSSNHTNIYIHTYNKYMYLFVLIGISVEWLRSKELFPPKVEEEDDFVPAW